MRDRQVERVVDGGQQLRRTAEVVGHRQRHGWSHAEPEAGKDAHAGAQHGQAGVGAGFGVGAGAEPHHVLAAGALPAILWQVARHRIMQVQVERQVGARPQRGDASRQVEDACLRTGVAPHAVLVLGAVGARAIAERPLQEVLDLDLRRLLDLQVVHLVGQVVHQREQLQELIGRFVGEPPHTVRTLLTFRLRPEVVGDAVAVAVAEPEAVVRLLHGDPGKGGVVEVDAAVRAQASQAPGMHRVGIFHGDAHRRTRPHRHAQRRRIEGHPVLVRHGPEAELVVVALIEHAQPGKRGTA